MMKTKYFISFILSVLMCISSFAQSNKGVEAFLLGDYSVAKQVFEQSKSDLPDLSNYYLGEIALEEGDKTKALEFYQSGLDSDADAVFCLIGKSKLVYSSDELVKELKDFQKKYKKNVEVLVQIAKAYSDANLPEVALKTLAAAESVGKTPSLAYLMEGDILQSQGKSGAAAGQYEQAYTFDPTCVVAYIKHALLYENTNSTTSIATLKSGLEANPENKLIKRYIGDIYYRHGFYQEAITSYEESFEGEVKSVDLLRNYAASFYFTQQYDKALTEIQKALLIEPDNRVLNRLLMYIYEKQDDFEKALVASQKLFTTGVADDSKSSLLATDYIVYGDILSGVGDFDQALLQYDKAVELDPDKVSVFKDIAVQLSDKEEYSKAGEMYSRYIDRAGNVENADHLLLGIAYYQAAVKASKSEDEVNKAEMPNYITQSEAAFTKFIDLLPDSYQGYYWRANTKTLLDPDLSQGLANSDYEKMIEVILNSDSEVNKNKLVEGYRYLSIYHLYQFDAKKKVEDKEIAKKYAEQVLELNASDATAIKILEVVAN